MDETEKFVNFIKEKFSKKDIRFAKFIFDTELLTYSMITEKVVENGKEINKPTNVLELSYLKLCAKNFDDAENLLEKMFLTYARYNLNEYKNTWRLNLNSLDTNLRAKCSYCETDCDACPFKLVAYIKKCVSDNNFDVKKVFDMLIDEKNEYNTDIFVIDSVVNEINRHIKNSTDLIGAEMLLVSDSVSVKKFENNKIYYKYLDFNVTTNSFFDNLNKYFIEDKGIEGELDFLDIKFQENFSYIFNQSPIEIAAYIKYICLKNNIDEEKVIDKLLKKRNFR